MVKLADGARLAGVSSGTASRVINGTGDVAPARVEAVERAVRDLDYRPNMVARSLRRQRSQTLGFVVPDVTNPFFSELALSVEITAARRGFSVILGNSENSSRSETTYLQNLVDRQGDGLAVVPVDATGALPRSVRATPTVILDRDIAAAEVDFVGADHEDGARQMVEYLVSLEHLVIGCITTERGVVTADERHAGYAGVAGPHFEEAGLGAQEYVWRGTFSFGSGTAGAAHLLQQTPRSKAIFASNDQQAIGAMRYCIDAGVLVPGDISIAEYDDIPLAPFVDPRLTTVSQPIRQIGNQAVAWLLDRTELACRRPRRSQRQRTHLELRESCGPPPKA
ncbi:LacI family DNA-binding transcriptional regulator [Georgenia sp. SYP-B2076]|uniref:LacI family DNA-binding transcriptional regulator n=1 Tax=Georgenia sp. SYP-B2076 TaxID=2495881 RepID=UPI000F8E9DF3|nr:LacI family DNA-binding transcriptional regulator [Georgenia sp. SYP-B2076]